ncbi:hypothetical protein QFZ76_004129 [Streptomyces sp. V4I2]|nr:hypothetical protein [Streptomyces sp. V4I2]
MQETAAGKDPTIVNAGDSEMPEPAAPPLKTIGDIRAALRSGHGFPGGPGVL